MSGSVEVAVISLRRPHLHATPAIRVQSPPVTWLALSLTLLRVPVGALAVWLLTQRHPIVAVALFVAVAVLDVFDGVAARAVGKDQAARRISDVLIDRVLIHAAALGACVIYNGGWMVWLLLLARDLAQAAFSWSRFTRHSTVVIGAHWHMSYGLSMLVWGSWFVIAGSPNWLLSVITLSISVATFIDYELGARRLLATN